MKGRKRNVESDKNRERACNRKFESRWVEDNRERGSFNVPVKKRGENSPLHFRPTSRDVGL